MTEKWDILMNSLFFLRTDQQSIHLLICVIVLRCPRSSCTFQLYPPKESDLFWVLTFALHENDKCYGLTDANNSSESQ